MSEEEESLSWYQAIAENPDYYNHTEQGQKELAEMIRKESERLLTELGKSLKRTREVIWLSRHCYDCKFFEKNNGRSHCNKWDVRIVKPFYGRAIWSKVTSMRNPDEKEMVVHDIDWNSKWKEISDAIIEKAVDMVNDGYPYFCFTRK
ncbi:MAG: hypothetical protein OK422_06115 [Thaumarchaeota archaeon]|nr:hypothetical protein [Nitrososphaerota archaeon]